MEVFRLARSAYATSLSGKGAALKGARWNSMGVELIYTAANRSLAMAEVAVHLSLATMPSDYKMLTIFIPDDIPMKKLTVDDLPLNWNAFPHPIATQKIGDTFVNENKYAILAIPSVVTKGDYNILINPFHSLFNEIKIIKEEPFPFDRRIFEH